MSSVSAGASEAKIRDALEKNLWALWSRFGLGRECVLHERKDALWFDTPIPLLPYNAVLRFRADSDVESRIDAIFGHYRRRGVPFLWLVHPSARPADLPDRLAARGFEEVENCPGMAMDLRGLPTRLDPPEGIEIREAAAADLESVLELVAWRWELPDEVHPKLPGIATAFEVGVPESAIRCWVAWRDGVPVSKVILNLDAGAAGLYGVATKPEARGLGLARILTLEALHSARSAGYELGVLHSSAMAFGLYEKIGYRPVAPFRIFAPPQSFHM